MKENEPYLDVDEAAAYLHLHSETVRRMARERSLPAVKIGRSWRFKVSALDKFTQKNDTVEKKDVKTIMCVDDDPDILDFNKAILMNAGFNVVCCESGKDVLRTMFDTDINIDLLILDLKLPAVNGKDILKQFHRIEPTVPVIILTAYPDSELIGVALKITPFTLLSKPCQKEQLLQTVTSLIGNFSPE